MNLRGSLVGTVAALATTVAWMGVADAAPVRANGSKSAGSPQNDVSYVRNWLSGKCADVAGYSSVNGARVQNWDCNTGTNQRWEFVPMGDGTYYYVVAQHSGKCLTVDTSHPNGDFGGDVNQWQCLGQNNQMWRKAYVGNNAYNLVARHNGKCLDLDTRGGLGNGATIHNWSCGFGTNQLWQLDHV
ncbi:RICIN domain-containing protein [Streptomyces syringium]|uniref:RICIN domain-containing protein n=1 Tax=Streptomyces syringium TaxID=76729 RepID=UPI003442D9DA